VQRRGSHEQADRAKLQDTGHDLDPELHDTDFKGHDLIAKITRQTNKVQRLSSGAESNRRTHSSYEPADSQTARAKLQHTGHDLELNDTDFKGQDFVTTKTLRV